MARRVVSWLKGLHSLHSQSAAPGPVDQLQYKPVQATTEERAFAMSFQPSEQMVSPLTKSGAHMQLNVD
jgi:hypothetical protein